MRFMKELLYGIVELLAKIHSYLLRFNDAYEYNFSDKELHFLVIGILGMMFIFVVYPVFKWLAKHDQMCIRDRFHSSLFYRLHKCLDCKCIVLHGYAELFFDLLVDIAGSEQCKLLRDLSCIS